MTDSPTSAIRPNDSFSPLRDLEAGESINSATYFYPLENAASESVHHMRFQPVEYNRANRNEGAKQTVLANIILPIPANLSAGYGANWGDVDLGIAGKALADPGTAAGQALAAVVEGDTARAGSAASRIDLAAAAKAVAPTIVRNLVSAIGETTGVKALEAAQLNLGKAINPHQAVLFQGVGFRNHTFAYKFIARSKAESDEIRDIINIFKYTMHPDVALNGNVFTFPNEWLIQFSKSIRNYMYDFLPCVLTGFTATYNGQGIPVFFDQTGAPVQIDISLTFKEVEILTKERLRKEFTKNGNFGVSTDEPNEEPIGLA